MLVLFLLALLNMMGFHRQKMRRWASRAVERLMGNRAAGRIFLRGRAADGGSRVPFSFRPREGDGQAMWECFGVHYEDALIRDLLEEMRIKYIVDAGANICAFSVSRLGLDGVEHLVAIEPQAENAALLSENLSGYPDARVIRAALGDREGTGWLEWRSSLASVVSDGEADGVGGREQVRVTRLVSVIPPEWPMNATWLKLDIEGAEYDCLKDLLDAGMFPVAISVEFHPPWADALPGIIGRLEALGYIISSDMADSPPTDCVHLSAVRCAVDESR